MANFSNYLEDHIIDFFLRNDAETFTPPATVHVALFLSPVSLEATDAALEANNPTTEVSTSGTAYARQEVVFDPAAGGVTQNDDDIDWAQATAAWGTVTHVAVVDHATNGTWGTNVNVLMWGRLTDAKTVAENDYFSIPTGDLVIEVQ